MYNIFCELEGDNNLPLEKKLKISLRCLNPLQLYLLE